MWGIFAIGTFFGAKEPNDGKANDHDPVRGGGGRLAGERRRRDDLLRQRDLRQQHLDGHEPGLHGPPWAKRHIQAGIDLTVDGDVVIVADGVYTGGANRNLDFEGRLITLRSANGPGACVIDCLGYDRAFHLQSGETLDAVIQGFTITNGSGNKLGGAMRLEGFGLGVALCPADCRQTPDGRVSVLDVLAMLSRWGDTSVGGPCDVDFDGKIGMEDFYLLLGAWGPCPQTTRPPTAGVGDSNGRPDPPPGRTILGRSATVGRRDLAVLRASWGRCDGDCRADLDRDGVVGVKDLLALLAGQSSERPRRGVSRMPGARGPRRSRPASGLGGGG